MVDGKPCPIYYTLKLHSHITILLSLTEDREYIETKLPAPSWPNTKIAFLQYTIIYWYGNNLKFFDDNDKLNILNYKSEASNSV